MKKNECFNLDRRKTELEKDIQAKDKEIQRLTALNQKLQQFNSQKDKGLDDTIRLEKLIETHNQ